MNKSLLQFVFIVSVIFIFPFLSSKVYAQQSNPYEATQCTTDPCSLPYYTTECQIADSLYLLAPWTTKLTGNNCCTNDLISPDYNACGPYPPSSATCPLLLGQYTQYSAFYCYNSSAPTPTPTPTPVPPTPTQAPCGTFGTCGDCISNTTCAWGQLTRNSLGFCSAWQSSCPTGLYSWKWQSCAINQCTLAPTSTPTPIGPTPTPTAGPTPTPFSCTGAIGIYNYSCSTDTSCTGGFISGYNPDTTCASQSQTCCFFPSSIPTATPFPTPTFTPTPTPTIVCTPGTTYSISGTVAKTNGQSPGKTLTLCLDPSGATSCTSGDFAYTNTNGAYSFPNVLSGTAYNVYLAPSSLPTGYSVFPPNPVPISSTVCSATANFTISAVPTPTPTPTPIGPTSAPTPTSPPGGPSCNYIDPPTDSPAVTLQQDGHTLNITYTLGAVSNPTVNFYRNTTPGFYETSSASATLFSTQFGNQNFTFHTNPLYPADYNSATYYNYQIVKQSGSSTSYSDSSAVAVRKLNPPPCGDPPTNPGTISGASEIDSTDTSLTFDLSYYVNSSSFFGCLNNCSPSVLPPYLKIQRSSSNTPSYIPFTSYQSLTPACTSQGIWGGWFGICTTTQWKARYALSLPPSTSDDLTVSSFDTNSCGFNKLNGSAVFSATTADGQPIALSPNPALTAVQPTDENGNPLGLVNLSWTPTQDAIDAQAYYREGALNRWPLTTQLPLSAPVWNGLTWTFSTTDDLKLLPSGTYYYGATVNYANVCAGGTVQTAQTAYNWAGKFYTVSGNVFVDENKNKLKDSGEPNYTGPITISSTTGSITYPGNGNFKVSDLPENTYTISYTSLPTGYQVSYPVNGPPPSFTVTVGTACSAGSSNSAACIGQGDIKDLNFGITNLIPWIQSVGLDLRIDSGFNDYIPSAALQPYASTLGTGGTGMPGIIFSGSNSYDFGQGQASPNPFNWIVGGPTYPEIFEPKQPGVIQTSYAYQIGTAQQNGLTPADIETFCTGGIANCTLSSILPHGLYLANGSLTINNLSYTFGSNQNYIILVNGDLTLNGNITVPNGSTVTFSVSGNINAAKNVTNIQGYYSADGNFTAQGINNCAVASDVQLKVEGSVVVNAGQSGPPAGGFQNQRDLCANDTTTPAVQFIERPDFIINAPRLIQFSRPIQKAVAP